MKILSLSLALGLMATSIGFSQGPLIDIITVNLPYPVNVNGTLLQPGDYEIRQHDSIAGGSRILHFFTNGGMKLETTAMAIPALDNRTPQETKLVLDHYGSDYYLNKVWVQGKTYGYEFPIPESVRLREKERNESASISAKYESAPVVAQAVTRPAEEPLVPAEVKQEDEVKQAPIAQVEAQPAPAPVEIAQNQPPTDVTPAPAPEMADRGERTMPHTAADWMNLLLGGGLLTGSGFALRRFRA